MNQPFAHTENELTPTITITRKDKLPPNFWLFLAILVLVVVAGRVLYNVYQDAQTEKNKKELQQIQKQIKAVSDTIEAIPVHIRNKARIVVHKQRELNQAYAEPVVVTVMTDSGDVAFFLRDSIVNRK